MRLLKNLVSCSLAAALALTLTPAAAWAADKYDNAGRATANSEEIYPLEETASLPNVTTHTQAEIIAWVKAHPFDTEKDRGYAVKPKLKAPYAAGKPSKTNLQEGLNALNAMRYIAGLDANVTFDETYNELAQAAALVNCINGKLSHYPSQPKGMDVALYERGCKGASSSNLYSMRANIASANVGYMDDSDPTNISRVGHRRWILNPTMGKTGVGYVEGFSATCAHDRSNSDATQSNVVWPAQNMPLEYFKGTVLNESSNFSSLPAWSVSTGEVLDASEVKVTLTRKSDGRTWTFSKAKADGDFYVDNTSYGQRGCVIFRPKNLADIEPGDRFRVQVVGIPQELDYTVNFFEIWPSIWRAKITVAPAAYTGKAIKPKVTVKLNGKTLRQGTDYKVDAASKPIIGMNDITVVGIGKYTGEKDAIFRVRPSKLSLSKVTAAKKSFTAKWKSTVADQEWEVSGYQVRYSTSSSMKNAKVKTIRNCYKTSLKVSGLKKGKKYYVQVRAYISEYDYEKGKAANLYSDWSKAKSVKVK
ncbi:fibronectin type III domain-containing protein [Adlercreutzia equolifaciens]|nr:fibronectin type III domain-containing protein [Adlercreutzia equolifaciens]